MKEQVFIIEKEEELLTFLLDKFKDLSRKKIKILLGSGQIYINNKSTTQFNHILKINDKVVIKNRVALGKVKDSRLKIIEETKDYIVVDKPAGLLSVATLKERDRTMYHIVSDYVKAQNPKNKIFVIHRLDKDTSGVLVFAKSEEVKMKFQKNWDDLVKRREYLAIVEGIVESDGELKDYLKEDKINVYVTNDKKEGKLAILEYRYLKSKNNMTWLMINLKTGRKNQIRVQMKNFNHPVIGDRKYESNYDYFKRLALHAHRLIITDPFTKETHEWVAEIPKILK